MPSVRTEFVWLVRVGGSVAPPPRAGRKRGRGAKPRQGIVMQRMVSMVAQKRAYPANGGTRVPAVVRADGPRPRLREGRQYAGIRNREEGRVEGWRREAPSAGKCCRPAGRTVPIGRSGGNVLERPDCPSHCPMLTRKISRPAVPAGRHTSSTAGTGGERRPSRCCSTASRRRCRRCSTPRRPGGEGVNVLLEIVSSASWPGSPRRRSRPSGIRTRRWGCRRRATSKPVSLMDGVDQLGQGRPRETAPAFEEATRRP